MELKNVEILESPDNKEKIRLVGDVSYDTQSLKSEMYWFEFDKKYSASLSRSGNPWLVCLLPLAMKLGEPIVINLPVDKQLVEKLQHLMLIWKNWYEDLMVVPIEVLKFENKEYLGQSTAAFFSGGVDSFFTVLNNENSNGQKQGIKVDDLISIYGFDIPIDNMEATQRHSNNMREIAATLKKELIEVKTNLRKTSWNQTDWGHHSHACGLLSIAHMLEDKYRNILIASTSGYIGLEFWGSHVITDPLLSSSHLKCIHDGAEIKRIDKTAYIADSDLVKRYLHVCWKDNSDKNCGQCVKCFRTITVLEVLGILDQFELFDQEDFNLSKAAKVYMPNKYDQRHFEDIHKLAEHKGRRDIVEAIECSRRYTERLNYWLPKTKRIDRWLSNKHLLWRLAYMGRRFLLRNAIYD